jgi:transposase
VSESTAIKWLERYRRDGLRGPAGHGGHRPSVLMPHREFLEAARAEKPDVTLQKLCDRVRSEKGRQSRHLDDEPVLPPDRRHAQKNTLIARERDRADIRRHRTRWRTYQNRIDPARLVFIDETFCQNQHDPPLRLGAEGRAPHRQGPARQMEDRDLPRRLRSDRIDAPCLFDGPINGERFRAYVEQFLVPTLKAGDVVILDNLGSHKGKAVRKAIRDVGARLVFLPKYSPDLNPIEQVFAKFKTLLRKVGARTYEAISAACGEILKRFPASQCAACLRNAGYA